jgi:hypothetical protein
LIDRSIDHSTLSTKTFTVHSDKTRQWRGVVVAVEAEVVAVALLDVLDAAAVLEDEPQLQDEASELSDAASELLPQVGCQQEPMVAAAATAGELRHHHHHQYMLSVIPLHILLRCRQ